MDDPCAMCCVKCACDLNRDAQDLVEWEWFLPERVGEGLSLEMLHDEKQHRLLVRSVGIRRVADVVQPADVRMRQRRDRLGFPFEPQAGIRVGRDARRQDLDGHRAVEADVPRSIDLAHTAGADQFADLVGAETRTRGEAHVGFGRDYKGCRAARPDGFEGSRVRGSERFEGPKVRRFEGSLVGSFDEWLQAAL